MCYKGKDGEGILAVSRMLAGRTYILTTSLIDWKTAQSWNCASIISFMVEVYPLAMGALNGVMGEPISIRLIVLLYHQVVVVAVIKTLRVEAPARDDLPVQGRPGGAKSSARARRPAF